MGRYIEVVKHYRKGDLLPIDVPGDCKINPACYTDSLTDQKEVKQILAVAGESVVCLGKDRCHLTQIEDRTGPNPDNMHALIRQVKRYKKVEPPSE